MIISIIGNGTSNFLYERNDKMYDIKICCNIPQHKFEYDVISIIDPQPVKIIKDKNLDLGKIWCPPDTYTSATRQNLKGEWCPVYKRKPWYNSGLLAIDYVCENFKGEKEFHLWGFNSIYENNFYSQMDTLVPRKRTRNLNLHWFPKWKEITAKYSECVFFFHIPSTESIQKELKSIENIKAYYHGV